MTNLNKIKVVVLGSSKVGKSGEISFRNLINLISNSRYVVCLCSLIN